MASMNKQMYLTTPIYYVNAVPHIGSAYCTLATDTLARFWRAKLGPEKVHFLTGTDENSQKTVEAAQKEGQAVGPYLDAMAARWRETFDTIGVAYDDFIRTTEKRHHHTVGVVLQKMYDRGDIYKGKYVGKYCVGCETFLKDSELDENGHCPAHKKAPKEIEEENYFFKLSAYQDKLLKFYEDNPAWVQPESRRNELLNFMKSGLEDLSISRENCEIGIPLPWDPSHKVYVWTEALINYVSAVYDTEKAHFWESVYHIVGKDITRFHCVIWPAMLMSADITLPKGVFAHGFFTVNGHKMSKSLGNVVDPLELAGKFGNDALRVGLLSSFEFGGDGDFSRDNFDQFCNAKLASGVGNLFNRVIVLVNKFLEGQKPEVFKMKKDYYAQFSHHMEHFQIKAAIDTMFEVVDKANERLNQTEVWKLAKTDLKAAEPIFAELLSYLEVIAKMAHVVLPESVEGMTRMLGDNTKVGEGEILFERV